MRKILIVGEHPSSNSGFANLLRHITRAFIDSPDFIEVTVLGTLAGVSIKDPDLDCMVLNASKYIATEGNVFGRDAIVKFLSNNQDYSDVLCLGDPWYYDGIPYTKAIFPKVTYHIYCPVEGETLPSYVHNSTNVLNTKVDLRSILKSFDNVIAYSKTGKTALTQLGIKVSDYVYHWTDAPIPVQKDMRRMHKLDEALQDKRVVGFIGRNVYRKGVDQLLKLAERLIGTDIVILAHVPKIDQYGWDISAIDHMFREGTFDHIVFTEDIIPGLYYKQHGNQLVREIKSGLSAEEMEYLYSRMDMFLSMSRGEGFGFPIIEAAVRGIPVMVNGFGTPSEIMNVLCDNRQTLALRADSKGSDLFPMGVWAFNGSCDADEFYHQLTYVIGTNYGHNIAQAHLANSKKFITEHSEYPAKFVNNIKDNKADRNDSPAVMVDSYLERCGIATYTSNLIKDTDITKMKVKNLHKIADSISEVKGKVFHIQYEPALWPLDNLIQFIAAASKNNKVVVTVHTENQQFIDSTEMFVSKYIFHKETPQNKTVRNKEIITHPIPENLTVVNKGLHKSNLGFNPGEVVIAINGFALPYKQLHVMAGGIIKLIAMFPDKYRLIVVCSRHQNDVMNKGQEIMDSITSHAKAKGVEDKIKVFYEFMEPSKMARILGAATFGLQFHNNATVGSQSGSVRELLSSEVIPIVTKSDTQVMHNDLIESSCALAINNPDSKVPVEPYAFTSSALNVISAHLKEQDINNIIHNIKLYKNVNSFSSMVLKLENIYKEI